MSKKVNQFTAKLQAAFPDSKVHDLTENNNFVGMAFQNGDMVRINIEEDNIRSVSYKLSGRASYVSFKSGTPDKNFLLNESDEVKALMEQIRKAFYD